MAELEATERSALNSRYHFLYFFRGIVAPGWYGGQLRAQPGKLVVLNSNKSLTDAHLQ